MIKCLTHSELYLLFFKQMEAQRTLNQTFDCGFTTLTKIFWHQLMDEATCLVRSAEPNAIHCGWSLFGNYPIKQCQLSKTSMKKQFFSKLILKVSCFFTINFIFYNKKDEGYFKNFFIINKNKIISKK